MKKTGIALLCLLLCGILAACSGNTGEEYVQVSAPQTTSVPDISAFEASSQNVSLPDPTVSSGPAEVSLPMGVYIDSNNGTYPRTTTFTGPFPEGKDIVVFAVMPSEEENLDGKSYREVWDAAAAQYPELASYKVGFQLVLTMKNGEEMRQLVLGPKDTTTEMTEYLELYVYDDIHQTPGAWYSHLTPDQVKEETIMTSCKLTAAAGIEEVEAISFTAFLYKDNNDFDVSGGQYTGNLQITVPVNRE